MPCHAPLQGLLVRNSDGSRTFKFCDYLAFCFSQGITPNPNVVPDGQPVSLPCGRCQDCRLERSRQWAMRCMHEAEMHQSNCFITLTYDEDHLPVDHSLDVSHFQLFMKRFRKKCGSGIRFYHCGEYGDLLGRPHYHACIFNYDFSDKVFLRMSNGKPLYFSQTLFDLWGKGFTTVGDLTFESAAYVARYVMKKVTGDNATEHYLYVHPETGVITKRCPEYATMSRRPGIGSSWYDKFKSDAYPSDFLVVNGKKCRPPRYYDTRFSLESPEVFDDIKFDRELRASKKSHDNTFARLKVKETVLKSRLSRLPRAL